MATVLLKKSGGVKGKLKSSAKPAHEQGVLQKKNVTVKGTSGRKFTTGKSKTIGKTKFSDTRVMKVGGKIKVFLKRDGVYGQGSLLKDL